MKRIKQYGWALILIELFAAGLTAAGWALLRYLE